MVQAPHPTTMIHHRYCRLYTGHHNHNSGVVACSVVAGIHNKLWWPVAHANAMLTLSPPVAPHFIIYSDNPPVESKKSGHSDFSNAVAL